MEDPLHEFILNRSHELIQQLDGPMSPVMFFIDERNEPFGVIQAPPFGPEEKAMVFACFAAVIAVARPSRVICLMEVWTRLAPDANWRPTGPSGLAEDPLAVDALSLMDFDADGDLRVMLSQEFHRDDDGSLRFDEPKVLKGDKENDQGGGLILDLLQSGFHTDPPPPAGLTLEVAAAALTQKGFTVALDAFRLGPQN